MDIREIKKEIKQLKKLKLKCRAGTKERISLGRQIKDLKSQLIEQNKPEPEKDKIISNILKIEADKHIKPSFKDLEIDLRKFSIKELNYHLEKLTKKGIKND